MGLNVKCPKCGSTHIQLSNERSKHGLIWLILFGLFYLIWIMFKWIMGLMVLICIDWWMAILKSRQGKGYVWLSKGFFTGTKKIYYCHDCHYNFRA